MKGMYTCKVCGRDFALMAEDHYVTREPEKKGLSAVIASDEAKMHDAFDCPHCGCQNIVGDREAEVFETFDDIDDDIEESLFGDDDDDDPESEEKSE